jgi:DeoR/GlpR family transcriptional regulator of sugar metabolism
MLLKVQRQAQIRRLVEDKRQVTVTELSTLLDVSEATVRRDLDEMDGRWLQRTHGGAVLNTHAPKELPVYQRLAQLPEIKRRIGQAAAASVQEGETIFISTGSTALEVARALPPNLRLTVISNSLPVVNELVGRANIELIAIGGLIRQDEFSMIGNTAELVLHEFRANRAFMGMRAIDLRLGFTNDYLPEILTDRAIIGMATQVVVVADHTKFGRVCSVFVAPVTAAQMIVTDREVDTGITDELSELGIQVIIA